MPTDFDEGRGLLERSLSIASEPLLPFAVGGALANLSFGLAELFRFAEAETQLEKGMAFATDHDDGYHLGELLVTRGQLHFYRGEWEQARLQLRAVLKRHGADFSTKALAQLLLARLGVRQGLPSAADELDHTLREYGRVDLLHPLGPMHAALAERAWLAGDDEQAARHARVSYDIVHSKKLAWFTGELAFWRWRGGESFLLPGWTAEPYAAQIAGEWHAAAERWDELDCPYERAMALMDGDQASQVRALEIFEGLGARPAAARLKRQMRRQGMRGIPRGPRRATRNNAFGLSGRELEVLACVASGANNSGIARELSLSVRTVEHHVASILRKTGAKSRSEAVALALRGDLSDRA